MQTIHIPKLVLAATFGLVLASSTFPMSSLANSRNGQNRNVGLPGRRISGGVREGNCFVDFNQSLVAIMPRNNFAKTAEARPAFWFSLPETEALDEVRFSLLTEFDEPVYSTQVDISRKHGLSELRLPESVPALVPGENYRWVFSLGCSDSSRFEVQGWVNRVELTSDMASQIESASPEDSVALYAAAGLWHEQVTELINLRRQNLADMDFQFEWAALVQSAGLTSEVSSNISEAMSPVESIALSTPDALLAPDR